MSPAQMFHLPTALKKKAVVVSNQRRQADRRDAKLHDVLGATEADINTGRNQSVSSAAITKFQSISLSDATTEAGHSPLQFDKVPCVPELHLKASSVLLHNDFEHSLDITSMTRSLRLRNYDSSSTLHSHYDAHMTPLAVSQQTSDSSRRDFALRKGKPVVIKSTTAEQDSRHQLKLLKSSKSQSTAKPKKLNKIPPQDAYNPPAAPVTPTDCLSLVDAPSTPKTTKSARSIVDVSKLYKGMRAHQPASIPLPALGSSAPNTRAKNSLLEPMDPACVKMNIRKPKVGATHWFDGHEGDSSEDESVDEPDFQQNFVLGIETAFQNDQIKANSSDASSITTRQLSSTISPDSGTPRSRRLPQQVPGTTPRVAVLNAKASKSNFSSISQTQSQKSRSNPLQEKDLNQSSVLNLSSDDEDDLATLQKTEVASITTGPVLRDSVAVFYNNDSQVEIGLAKAINAGQKTKSDLPRPKKLKAIDQQPPREHTRMPIPKRGSSLMLSYLSDQCETQDEATDVLASFPATPIEGFAPCHRTSVRSSAATSDAGSMDSRRLMSVTRQEESLLAAMRLKKAAMRYHVTQDKRLEALQNLERVQAGPLGRIPIGQQKMPSISQLSLDSPEPFEPARTSQRQHRRSLSGDDSRRLRASGTTFQTTTSRNASRMSKLTSQTDNSSNIQTTRLSLSSSNDSERQSTAPSLVSLLTPDQRQSRDTYFSSSSAGLFGGGDHPNGAGGHTRNLTINSHVVALDDLDKIPKRDGIPSQEFIDWPYKGWEARSELGVAR